MPCSFHGEDIIQLWAEIGWINRYLALKEALWAMSILGARVGSPVIGPAGPGHTVNHKRIALRLPVVGLVNLLSRLISHSQLFKYLFKIPHEEVSQMDKPIIYMCWCQRGRAVLPIGGCGAQIGPLASIPVWPAGQQRREITDGIMADLCT